MIKKLFSRTRLIRSPSGAIASSPCVLEMTRSGSPVSRADGKADPHRHGPPQISPSICEAFNRWNFEYSLDRRGSGTRLDPRRYRPPCHPCCDSRAGRVATPPGGPGAIGYAGGNSSTAAPTGAEFLIGGVRHDPVEPRAEEPTRP